MRHAFLVVFLMSAILVAYQLRSSITVMFARPPSVEGEALPPNTDNDNNGVEMEKKVVMMPVKPTFAFGEKFPAIERTVFTKKPPGGWVDKDGRRVVEGKQRVRMNAENVKKTISSSFISGLERAANAQRQVLISIVDHGFLDFAVNFKEVSIDRLNISNFLLVCTDKRSHLELNLLGVPCSLHQYGNAASDMASDFGTAAYYEKTNVKTAIVIQALSLGYTVLVVDLDVILFRDPFPHFPCEECDIHFQMDRDLYNSGFVYVRPTPAAQALYNAAWNLYVKYQRAHDQAYINMAVKVLSEKHRLPKIHSLSTQTFQCGVYYFEHGNRMFENKPTCEKCVMAHNNYLGSTAAKVYRFRENFMWMVDNGAYYSNVSARYLMYENPFDFGLETRQREVEALKSALVLATVMNRLVILPTFRCCTCNSRVECSHPMHRCPLLSVLRLKPFDEAFHELYREHVFLKHPKVPPEVSTQRSPCLFINSSLVASNNISDDCRIFQPSNSEDGATIEEMEKWFGPYENVSVLHFHSLYGAHSSKQFDRDKRLSKLKQLMTEEAFKCSEYEQWDESAFKF